MTDATSTADTGPFPTPATFAPFVGDTIGVATGSDAAHPLVLAGIEPIPHSPRPGGGFRLTFRGPTTPYLPQGTYAFRFGDAELAIFIVPLGPRDEHMQYEAIFF